VEWVFIDSIIQFKHKKPIQRKNRILKIELIRMIFYGGLLILCLSEG